MLFYFILLHLIVATPQLNLHYTKWVSESKSEDDNALQHNCLHIHIGNKIERHKRITVSYCMSELPSKFNIQKNNQLSKFTFAELLQQNITSDDLYIWSAPIDIIEDYQLYLDELSMFNKSNLTKNVYYNCTIPRFGPMCEYELPYYYHANHSSLTAIIEHYYRLKPSSSNDMTCYMHLQCDRGIYPSCLDWSEICNGQIDCLNGGIDEEHCWELEINECEDDEYRCHNGQCIPQSFDKDETSVPDCIDTSDLRIRMSSLVTKCHGLIKASIPCQDITCIQKSSPFTMRFMTSSCAEKRGELLMETMYSTNNDATLPACWLAFKCLIQYVHPQYSTCAKWCKQNDCKKIVLNTCPNTLFFPNTSVLFGNIYFIYKTDDLQNRTNFSVVPFYICYNTTDYDDFLINMKKISIKNMTCVHSELLFSLKILPFYSTEDLHLYAIDKLYQLLKKYHLPFSYTSTICNRSNMYQCLYSSKCISIYRLMDNIIDCSHMDDENMAEIYKRNLTEQLKKTHFKCESSNKYIHHSLVKNDVCNCNEHSRELCEDENSNLVYIRNNISFQHICDGFVDLSLKRIAELNGTDESECKHWQCNNIYTRCNHVWNCPNGADEAGCDLHSTLNCSSKHHLCVVPDTNQFMCLPIERANDGHIDCLGATDEPALCGTLSVEESYMGYKFYCMNQSSQSCITTNNLCDGYTDCQHEDDEQFCTLNQTVEQGVSICIQSIYIILSNVEQFLCNHRSFTRNYGIIPFQLLELIESVENEEKNNNENPLFSHSPVITMFNQHQHQQYRCHHGFDVRVWLYNKNNSIKNTCFCPPSYYGDQCQYQNQRISLAIQFQVLSDSRKTLFGIVISLIDDSDQRIIHSYQQITYLSVRDCPEKVNFNLVYSTRPKNPTQNYAIQVDIYEKQTLAYRGSLLYPIKFSFLPVHRLAFIVNIPSINHNQTHNCTNDRCIHGQCIKYYNNTQYYTFCRCYQGWSGKYCSIAYNCTCSSNLSCIGISSNNQSICICPINKFGPRCLLTDMICKTNDKNSTCQNGGECVPDDDYFGAYQNVTCICPKGFSGERCEISVTKLILSFNESIILSQSIFIHFMEILPKTERQVFPVRATTFQTIPFAQDSITIYWTKPFRLVFIELIDKIYYLTVVQKNYKLSTTINKMIHSSDRCPNITELFNQTFLQWPLIRRIKYYHLPCQNRLLNLSCFHDEVHFCLCYDFHEQRLANCFNFDHNMKFDCSGKSECENDGQCLQDNPDCPTKSLCVCQDCYYGSRCQFSTKGFGLSLDAILGYHIIPHLNINEQRLIIKISLAITIIFMMIGFVNGIVCILTFKNKVVCEVGCGLYLFGTSITTLVTMFMFGLKFLIFVLTQMTVIKDRTFLSIQCHSFDFILRVCLNLDQWLNACVAIERAVTVIKAVQFDKKTSKRTAKYVIVILLVGIIISLIHDPIYRHLIDEDNEYDDVKRIWCVITYPSGVEIYDYIIHSFHFFGPFLINIISSIILITKKSRQQLTLHSQQTYNEILRKQLREHRHLLTAPIILVCLAIPRLILTFISRCMKPTNEAWLFLVGYFISFIPSMLTFVIFIFPSKFYKTEFRKSIKQFRSTIQRSLHLAT